MMRMRNSKKQVVTLRQQVEKLARDRDQQVKLLWKTTTMKRATIQLSFSPSLAAGERINKSNNRKSNHQKMIRELNS